MFSSAHTTTRHTLPTLGNHLASEFPSDLRTHGFSGNLRVEFLSLKVLAEGGEGWILDARSIKQASVIKLLKPPSLSACHDLSAQKHEQYQHKLPILMGFDLPKNAVKPDGLITKQRSKSSQVLAFFMPKVSGHELTELTTTPGRTAHATSKQNINRIFLHLTELYEKLRSYGIIIGDQKPQNYLVPKSGIPHLIDLDNVEFGDFKTASFTERYIDPLICDKTLDYLVKQGAYSEESDRYSFAAMLFECLTGIDPYAGVISTKSPFSEIPDSARALNGISVLHPHVSVPSFIDPLLCLPENLTDLFRSIFEKFNRVFSHQDLLASSWTECRPCQIEYARNNCPSCSQSKEGIRITRGKNRAQKTSLIPREGKGIAAMLSVHSDELNFIRVRSSDDRISLKVNEDWEVKDLKNTQSLILAPTSKLLIIGDSTGSVEVIQRDSPRTYSLPGCVEGAHGYLVANAENFFGYINQQGDLNLLNPEYLPHANTFPLAITSPTHLALGQRIIVAANQCELHLLHTSAADPLSLSRTVLKIPSNFSLSTLECHRYAPYALAGFVNTRSGEHMMKVMGKKGEIKITIESEHCTDWWFDQQNDSESVGLIYQQNKKLCLSRLDLKNSKLYYQWGISGIPHIEKHDRPFIVGNYVYLLINSEFFSLKLL